jgi:hypothetical protein
MNILSARASRRVEMSDAVVRRSSLEMGLCGCDLKSLTEGAVDPPSYGRVSRVPLSNSLRIVAGAFRRAALFP